MYKNKTNYIDEFRVSLKGKIYNLAEMAPIEIEAVLVKIEEFLFKKKVLLTNYQTQYEKNKNFHYSKNTSYLEEKTHKAIILSIDAEIRAILFTFDKVQLYRNSCLDKIILVKGESRFLAQNVDEVEIPEKLKAGYSFENKRQYRDYLNRRFAQNVDFRKVKGSKVAKITQ